MEILILGGVLLVIILLVWLYHSWRWWKKEVATYSDSCYKPDILDTFARTSPLYFFLFVLLWPILGAVLTNVYEGDAYTLNDDGSIAWSRSGENVFWIWQDSLKGRDDYYTYFPECYGMSHELARNWNSNVVPDFRICAKRTPEKAELLRKFLSQTPTQDLFAWRGYRLFQLLEQRREEIETLFTDEGSAFQQEEFERFLREELGPDLEASGQELEGARFWIRE